LAKAELGQDAAAAADLALYLQHMPDAVDATAMRGRMRALGGGGRARPLH
jgi:regulator of sirC expression with transglutaminase-like and TPR domain